MQNYSGEEELCCVYVPTNHLYIGDVFLVNSEDVIRPNLSVREGIGEFFFLCRYVQNQWTVFLELHMDQNPSIPDSILFIVEIVVSGGMSMPQILSILNPHIRPIDSRRMTRS